MTPWLDDGDIRLYHGDCLDVLRSLPDRSVHMCATSPPFYGLRDYGVDGQIGLEPVPCTVLDPFAGSGTTLKVARDHARHAIGIELNEDYCRIAADRLAQQSLLTGEAA